MFSIEVNNNLDNKFNNIFEQLYKYMIDNNWAGACHAITAILYAVAKKLGIKCVPCIGVVKKGDAYFDHSWLEIEGNIYDIAIALPLEEKMATGPIFNNFDLSVKGITKLEYGVENVSFDPIAEYISKINIYEYIKRCPDPNLIKLIINIASMNQIYITRKWLENNLNNEFWFVK